ncbi:hypothetical protein BH23ACI1_BH23ACI1_19240 [soil metagenome]
MATINATVYWDADKKKPKVDKDPILVTPADGETTITWSAGDGIESFEIKDLTTDEFTFQTNSGPAKTFSAVDKNNRPGKYPYKVKATHSGITAEHDPKIENGSGMS